MKLTHCKQRKINKMDIETPILVPSFSSKGFKDIGEMHNYFKDYLLEASLVSAYDLHYGHIQHDKIYESEIVFIDSGGYERDKEHDLSDIYGDDYKPKVWNEKLHLAHIEKVEPLSRIVIINYDYIRRLPLELQIEKADNFFRQFPEFSSDFLCKPISENSVYINIDDYCNSINKVSSFSILGFTEKELGSSVIERCRNILRIRKALEQADLDIPIHIFGCLDPLNIMVYFISGADIFDGLSWLRFSFIHGIPTYFNSYAIQNGLWKFDDLEVKALALMENLQYLSNMKNRMIDFSHSYDWDALELESNILNQIQDLIRNVEEGA